MGAITEILDVTYKPQTTNPEKENYFPRKYAVATTEGLFFIALSRTLSQFSSKDYPSNDRKVFKSKKDDLTLYQTPIVVDGEVRALVPLPKSIEAER